MRSSFKWLGTCGLCLVVLTSCTEATNVGPDLEPGMAALPVMVSAAPGLSTLVVEVSAADIPIPFTFNLTMVDGSASDTVTIPVGSDRVITVRGFDAGNIETHRGSTTIDLVEGANAAVTVFLDPLVGDQPIVVVMGTVTVEVSPVTVSASVGSSVQLTGVVLNNLGDTLAVAPVWSSLDLDVATVDETGLVTGISAGSATIVGTFAGAGASAVIEFLDEVAFYSDRDGNLQIYVMNSDGSDPRNVSNNSFQDYTPVWSPDGRRIAFASTRDGNYEIYTMAADGSDVLRLTEDGAEDQNPQWSPDGSRIAFRSRRDGNDEIYVMGSDGSNPTRITSNTSQETYLTWSPDGQHLAVETDRDGNAEIYVMSAGGADQHNVSNNAASDIHPSWSPDGSQLVFASDRSGDYEIYLMDVDGSAATRLTEASGRDDLPTWGAQGRILFRSSRDGSDYEIWSMAEDGSDATPLTQNSATDEYASYRPIRVLSVSDVFSIVRSPLPYALVDAFYGPHQLQTTGGTNPVTWRLAPGSYPLPSGLTLEADGQIAGVPTALGVSMVTVEAESADGRVARSFVTIVVAPAAYQVDVTCFDRLGAPSPCDLRVSSESAVDTVRVGRAGRRVLVPADELVTLSAIDTFGVFNDVSGIQVQGPSGAVEERRFDLAGRGGEFCGGTPRSLATVTVRPASGCPDATTVSTAQEAILLVQHGGTIQFGDGEHTAWWLDVPVDDITLQSVPGEVGIILPGTPDPSLNLNDGAGFHLLGRGRLVVRDLTFNSAWAAGRGIGFIPSKNSIYGAGSYSEVVVEDVTFNNLRYAMVATPSRVPGASATVQNSTIARDIFDYPSTQIYLIGNNGGASDVRLVNNTFVGPTQISSRSFGEGGVISTTPMAVLIRGNTMQGCYTACIQLSAVQGLAAGSAIESNILSGELGVSSVGISALLATTAEGPLMVSDNELTGPFASGISLRGTGSARVVGNVLTAASLGIDHQGVSLTLNDNVVSGGNPLRSSDGSLLVEGRWNDFTGWSVPYQSTGTDFSSGSLRCNWWGNVDGPGTAAGTPADDPIHSPWAVAPVAGQIRPC
jgi:Tol biopolymer transport system component